MTDSPVITKQTAPVSNVSLWIGRIISAIPVLMMFFLAIFFAVFKPQMIKEGMTKYGYPEGAAWWILGVEIVSAALYMIPQTSVLGAILLTGYLGGATATHVRAGEAFFVPVVVGVLVWLGLFLRDRRIRALIPLRK